jgi:hypothetical protein
MFNGVEVTDTECGSGSLGPVLAARATATFSSCIGVGVGLCPALTPALTGGAGLISLALMGTPPDAAAGVANASSKKPSRLRKAALSVGHLASVSSPRAKPSTATDATFVSGLHTATASAAFTSALESAQRSIQKLEVSSV